MARHSQDELLMSEVKEIKQSLNDLRTEFRTEIATIKADVRNVTQKVAENSDDIKNLQFKTIAIVTGLATIFTTGITALISFFKPR